MKRKLILTQKLEGISKKIFERYQKVIIQYIEGKPGVYALYDEKELYYVGRAVDLKRRVKYHLKDHHAGLWTHFSVYFAKKPEYVYDIEAVAISIAQPKGNKEKPKIGKETKLKDLIRKEIQEKHKEELSSLGLVKVKRNSKAKKKSSSGRPDLKNYFKKNKPLMKIYKGKKYKATLLKSGKIKYNNKIYNSLSTAGEVVVSRVSKNSKVNGWDFWFIQDSANNWIKMSELD